MDCRMIKSPGDTASVEAAIEEIKRKEKERKW